MNILVADDEIRIRENFIKRLVQLPVSFDDYYQAENGLEALEIINQQHIDIALIDINMPLLNGLELIKAIRTSKKDTHVVIISGYDNFSYAQEAITYGVKAYLLKPVNRKEFEEVILSSYSTLQTNKEKTLEEKIIKQIGANMTNPKFNLSDLANDMALSPGHLSKVIINETGHSFVELLTMMRVDYAKKLLLELPIGTKIYEIADLVGYNNQYYFSSVFKKETGLSPKEFVQKKHHSK